MSDRASRPSPAWPTAQALLADVASTAVTSESEPGLMAGTIVQDVPFQCSVSVWVPAAVLVPPTAQALPGEMAVRAVISPLVPGGRLGLFDWVQAVPFHRSISVWLPVSVSIEPTAHALVADVATTEESAVSVPGLGLGLTVQAVPSQCSMSVASPLPHSVNPTAHTSVADLAKTDWNGALWLAGEGLN